MIYDQKGSTCTGFALAGAMNNVLGIEIPESEIYAYYAKYDDDRPGIRITTLLKNLKDKETFGGHHVKDFDTLFNQRNGMNNYKNGICERTKHELEKMDRSILVGFKLSKSPLIALTKDNEYICPKRPGGLHMMFIKDVWKDKYGLVGFIIQNSWGKDFGNNGTFKISKENFYKNVQMVVSIKL